MTVPRFPKMHLRVCACLSHLLLSAFVASLVAVLVFKIWYPFPYSRISGGFDLFIILVVVDVVVGPILTLVVFSPSKSLRERALDMAVVVTLQLLALGYGVWSMYQARPIQLIYEYGQFGIAHAADVDLTLVSSTFDASEAFPTTGPRLKSLRPFIDSNEAAAATLISLQGLPLAARADLWQTYEAGIPDLIMRAKPLSHLYASLPSHRSEIEAGISQLGVNVSQLLYVPLAARGKFWTVLIHSETGYPLSFLPIDSF